MGWISIGSNPSYLFTLYPQPIQGSALNIEGDIHTVQLIEICDLNGTTVLSETPWQLSDKITIEIEDLPSGIYILKINAEAIILTRKIIVL